MADSVPTTIDGSDPKSAVNCSRCERLFSSANLVHCSACKLELCADCLGDDRLRFCLSCLDVSGLKTTHRHIPAMIIQSGEVPREWQLTHGYILRQIDDAHVEFVSENLRDRIIAPTRIIHGAKRQLATLRKVA